MTTHHTGAAGARTAVILTGAGVLLALGVLPALGYSQVNADGAPLDVGGTSGAVSVAVSVDVGDVVVVPADGDDITWHVHDGDARTRVDVREEGGTLVIDVEELDRGWFGWNGFRSSDVHLEVPAGIELFVDAGVGDVDVRGELGDIDLRSDVGDVTVAGTASSAVVVADVGDIDARGLWSAGTLDLRSDVGDVRVDTGAAEPPGGIRASSSVGSVSVAVAPVVGAYDVRVSSSVGDVADRVTVMPPPGSGGTPARGERSLIDVSSSVGDVTVEYSVRD